MQLSTFTTALVWAASVGRACAGPAAVVGTRREARLPTDQRLRQIARGLNAVRKQGEDVSFSSNRTVLDTSWSGATLLKQGLSGENKRQIGGDIEVEIICETCYIKGAALATITVQGDLSTVIANYTAEVKEEVRNVTESVVDQVSASVKDTIGDVFTGEIFDNNYDFEFPTIDVDFDLDLPPLPGVSVAFRFEEDFELYMLLNTKLAGGATYTLNLFASKTALGIAIGNDITAGVAMVIDLILDVRTAIEISSGFHLKLDKGVGMKLDMFSQNVSDLAFPGGQFEFLPVSIVTESAVLKGVLRITLKAGLEFDSGGLNLLENTPFSFEAGVVAEVFANVAEFTTNVTGPALSTNRDSNNGQCDLEVVQGYQFALGAAAGATVAIGFNTWGPMPATTIPIFYTTLASACAVRKPSTVPAVLPATTSTTATTAATTTTNTRATAATTRSRSTTTTRKSSSSSSTAKTTATTRSSTTATTARTTTTTRAQNNARQNTQTAPNTATRTTAPNTPAGTAPKTTTLLSTKIFTAQTCLSTGLINCPASLQASSTYKSVLTFITALPPGAPVPTFPATKFSSVVNTVVFGSAAQKMVSTSGSPTSFVPGATGTPGGGNWLEGNSSGVSNKIILGISVGVGALVLLFLANWVLFLFKRRSYDPLASREASMREANLRNAPAGETGGGTAYMGGGAAYMDRTPSFSKSSLAYGGGWHPRQGKP